MSEVRGPESDARAPEDRFDIAIDRAVREVLDVQPPPGLRGRVMQRIAHPASYSDRVASAFRRKILWMPLAAAAVLIVAVVVPWRGSAPALLPATTQVARIEPLPRTPPLPARVATQPSPRVEARPQPSPKARVSGAATRVVAEGRVIAAAVAPPAGAVAIEPLDDLNPIQVPGVASTAIAPRDVVVTPLAPLAQVQISPLFTSAPDGRN